MKIIKTNLTIYGKKIQYCSLKSIINYLFLHILFLKDCISPTAFEEAFTFSISVWQQQGRNGQSAEIFIFDT